MIEGKDLAVDDGDVEGCGEETMGRVTFAWWCRDEAERDNCYGGGEETRTYGGIQLDIGVERFEDVVREEL